MEQSHTQNSFEFEPVVPSKFLLNPLDFCKALSLHRHKLLISDTLQSPLITSDSTPKLRPHHANSSSFINLNESKDDDDFALDPTPKHDKEEENIQGPLFPQGEHQNHLDIIFEPNSLKVEEYALDCYRIRRSRVPSFNLERDRKGSEDLFSPENDFKQLFCRSNDKTGHESTPEQRRPEKKFILLSDDDEDNVPEVRPFPTALMLDEAQAQYQILIRTEEMMCLGKRQFAQFEECSGSVQNSSLPEQDIYSLKIKKKRKVTNDNGIIVKREEEEGKVQPSRSFRNLKPRNKLNNLNLVKRPFTTPRKQRQSAKSRLNKRHEASLKSENKLLKREDSESFEDKVSQKMELEHSIRDKKTEEPTTPFDTKMEDISSTQSQQKTEIPNVVSLQKMKMHNFFGGFELPPEVEELLSKSKILHNIQLPFVKKVGPLTVEERRAKVERYLLKRKDRTWNKRINYDCRKRVADSRLRFKGRFVTKSQIMGILDLEGITTDIQKMSDSEIKGLLEKHFGSDIENKRSKKDGNNHNKEQKPRGEKGKRKQSEAKEIEE